MNNTFHQVLTLLLFGVLLTGATCSSNAGGKQTKPQTGPLTMTSTENGKWAIVDSQKTTLYEVFLYDNGPDYPSEGLIRVLKNGKIGYADANTYALVIEPQFDCAYPFENGKARVSKQCQTRKDGEHSEWISDDWRYIDKQGNFIPGAAN